MILRRIYCTTIDNQIVVRETLHFIRRIRTYIRMCQCIRIVDDKRMTSDVTLIIVHNFFFKYKSTYFVTFDKNKNNYYLRWLYFTKRNGRRSINDVEINILSCKTNNKMFD